MAKKVRFYRIVHEPYLSEFLRIHYPPFVWKTNVRLGLPHEELVIAGLTPEERRMLTRWRLEVDAIVLEPELVTLIETIVRPEWWKIPMLLLYERLFKVTEEYRDHWHKYIRKLIVTPLEAPFFRAFAADIGVDWAVYAPDWIKEYLQTLWPRRRRFAAPAPRHLFKRGR